MSDRLRERQKSRSRFRRRRTQLAPSMWRAGARQRAVHVRLLAAGPCYFFFAALGFVSISARAASADFFSQSSLLVRHSRSWGTAEVAQLPKAPMERAEM